MLERSQRHFHKQFYRLLSTVINLTFVLPSSLVINAALTFSIATALLLYFHPPNKLKFM